MHAVGLVRQAAQHIVSEHDNSDTTSAQTTLNLCCAIGPALASVISTRLQNNGTGPVWHGAIQTVQHSFGGVAINAGVHHVHTMPSRPQYRFKLGRKGLIARDSLPVSIACAERHYRCRVGGRDEEQKPSEEYQASNDNQLKGTNSHIFLLEKGSRQ